MANINRVLLAGNLTRDPQVRFLANEQAVVNFGIAVNRNFKGADGSKKEEVTFVDVEAWGRTAELVGQYLTKGRPCFIEGRLKL
ncbi:MAG: single-stranded DNA-binding protein, partial [Planctomycetota bacterium]